MLHLGGAMGVKYTCTSSIWRTPIKCPFKIWIAEFFNSFIKLPRVTLMCSSSSSRIFLNTTISLMMNDMYYLRSPLQPFFNFIPRIIISSALHSICRYCNNGDHHAKEFQESLRVCSRCQATYYSCSKECQRADWKKHKLSCNPMDREWRNQWVAQIMWF